MKKRDVIIAFCMLFVCSCGKNKLSMSDECYQSYQKNIKTAENVEKLLSSIEQFSADDIKRLSVAKEDLYFNYDPLGMDSATLSVCKDLKTRVDNLRELLSNRLKEEMSKTVTWVTSNEDYLIKQTETYPIYMEKGETLKINFSSEKSTNIKIYNIDSQTLLKNLSGVKSISESINVKNKAIYLVEITPTASQYISFSIGYIATSLERVANPKKVYTETVEAQKGDFRVKMVKGIKMQNLFEEPRKITLRGQLKAMFSGSSRAVVAVQVPQRATDIMYSLRISTSEIDRSEDGEFSENLNRSYREIRLLGLPLYESRIGSGLLATILDDNRPIKEEDAYCNMYVFTNSAQAKKFQDGMNVTNLKYNIDYSTLGTQSCNGRIPTMGLKTIYLGFENERMRYANYLWIEAVSAVPNTEYFKERYYSH